MLGAQFTDFIVSLNQSQMLLSSVWNNNSYWGTASGLDFRWDAEPFSFFEWRLATGYDTASTYTLGLPAIRRVFIRPNRYEPGRGHIVVYNWALLSSQTVDLSSVLVPGENFEVRNAQDMSGPPVASGIYSGQAVQLPMTGLTVAAPNGPLLTPPPTGPAFNVFVVQPRVEGFQITITNGNAKISWPTNYGPVALQVSTNFDGSSPWVNDTNLPALSRGRYIVTEPCSLPAAFFRLQGQ
jgi:hypothetical protein